MKLKKYFSYIFVVEISETYFSGLFWLGNQITDTFLIFMR